MRYGVDIMAVCREVQQAVKRAVENLVGIEVSSVDIIVENIDLAQNAQAKS
ncbi:MAG: Asp23/Gls24 family envelope stress response protein [bacterium]